ncbi:MAG: DUF459 domain-containing protein, partial [Rhizobiaceae bacterium]
KKPRKAKAVAPTLAAAPRAPEPAIKAEDARRIVVVGDFIAGGLADGLIAALKTNPSLVVIDRSNGSSGFVRDDHYDWTARIAEIVEAEKPAVLVMAIGSNDRQSMKIDASREQPMTDTWNADYARRVNGFADAVKATGTRLVWVGQPSFKPPALSSAMIAFNDVYRAAAARTGATFVDVWDGFVDEAGVFTTTGPDINGQPARLRANDGINLTEAGRRKMAFYAEKPLGKLFASIPSSALSLPAAVRETEDSAPAPVIDRMAPLAIDDPALDGGGELLGATVAGGNAPAASATAPAGRADAFPRPKGALN